MTGTAPPVDVASLDRERQLGKGGQGEVWAIRDRLINKEWPIAYKQYSPTSLRAADMAALDAMVGFVPSLEAAVGRWLCEHSAWPAALVGDSGGRALGFLMRQVPDEYVIRLATQPDKPVIAGFQYLLNPAPYLNRVGIALTDRQRLLLLRDLADLLDRLHRLGVAVGDLSPNNLLFTLRPTPSCFFIDCDAMRLRGRSVLKQTETPGWEIPAGEELATPASDRFKYSLLSVRLFMGDQDGRDTGALTGVSPRLAELARLGLSDTPAERPPLREWQSGLEEALALVASRPAAARNAAPGKAPGTASGPAPGAAPGTSAAGTGAGAGTAGAPRAGAPRAGAPGPGRGGPVPVPQPGGKGVKPGTVVGWLVALVAVIVFVVHLAHSSGSSSASGTDSAPGVTATSTDPGDSGSSGSDQGGSTPDDQGDSPSAGDPGADEAAAVDKVLQEETGTRGGVQSAVQAVQGCGTNGTSLSDAASTFSAAHDQRAQLVSEVSGLNVSDLDGGAQALSDLSDAWTASADADAAFYQWANGLDENGCDPDSTANAPGFSDATAASDRATAAKQRFVAEWNPIARQYGLTTYSWDEL